jgi:hypothetical protein
MNIVCTICETDLDAEEMLVGFCRACELSLLEQILNEDSKDEEAGGIN